MATHPSGIKIDVTTQDIETAKQSDSSHCMVADAIKRALPYAKHVSVDIQTIRFSDWETWKRSFYLTPRLVQKAIIAFDQGNKDIQPFSFTLRQPHNVPMNTSSPREANKGGVVTQPKGKDRIKTTELANGKKSPTLVMTEAKKGWPSVKIGRRRQFGLRAFEP